MIVEIAVRILGRNVKHTTNAIIGIALVIAMIISLFGIISGFSTEIDSLVSQIGGSNKIVIMQEGKTVDSSFISTHIVDLCKVENVKVIIGYKYAKVIMQKVIPLGSSPSFEGDFWGVNITSFIHEDPSAFISTGYLPNANNEVLVGEKLNQYLNVSFLTQDKVNVLTLDPILNRSIEIKVAGTFYVNNYYSMGMLGSMDTIDFLNPSLINGYSLIELYVDDPRLLAKTVNTISKILLSEGSFSVEGVLKNKEFLREMFSEIISKFQYFSLALYVIVLIKVFHSIVWLLVEHEYDFVLLRTLGVSRVKLSSMAFLMTILLGNMGLVFGISLGLCFPEFVVGILALLLNVRSSFFMISLDQLIVVVIVSNICFVIGGFWPSYRASKRRIREFQSLNEM